MESLMDSTTGTYRVATVASTYVVDLDREVVRREPRDDRSGGLLLGRDELLILLRILECTVGRPMILLLDLHLFGVPFTARLSTQVVLSIDPEPTPARVTVCSRIRHTLDETTGRNGDR